MVSRRDAQAEYLSALKEAQVVEEQVADELAQLAADLDRQGLGHMADQFVSMAHEFRVQSIKHAAQAAVTRALYDLDP